MRKIPLFCLVLFLLLKAVSAVSETHPEGLDWLNRSDITIGVPAGTNCGPETEARLPEATVQYLNSHADMLASLRSGKVDAIVTDEGMLRLLTITNPDLEILDEKLSDAQIAASFPMTEAGRKLCEAYSEFVSRLWDDDTMDEIGSIWFGGDDTKKTVLDYENLPDTNGTLTMAADASLMPFAYIQDDRIVGYDVDVAARFCQACGYRLIVQNMSFDGVLAAVQGGKCDFASSGMTVTPERAEKMLFSVPIFHSGNVLAILKKTDTAAAGSHFTDGIRSSFERTFIRENRWMLFLRGIRNTLIITMASILLGAVLGFSVYMLCRNGSRLAGFITRPCLFLVQGTPMVVLLMILYYIVFGKTALSGTAVAIFGFALIFGASVYGLLNMGVNAVDKGQFEGAYALGYSRTRTFFRIILPQAITHIIPAFRSEIISLIKATAIVGYIAVEDLTKMGDIVRSRTYEAFFPLIAVTVIYFVLEAFLNLLIRLLERFVSPGKRNREKILRGLNVTEKSFRS